LQCAVIFFKVTSFSFVDMGVKRKGLKEKIK
jgi:hypothetical protein